jgi:hypothetical protein
VLKRNVGELVPFSVGRNGEVFLIQVPVEGRTEGMNLWTELLYVDDMGTLRKKKVDRTER